MKIYLALIIALVIGLSGIGQMAFASAGTVLDTDAQMASAVEDQEIVKAIQIQGIMQASDQGVSLECPNSTYQLKGCENLEGMEDDTIKSMMGKLVKVSGDLERTEAGLFIHVRDLETIN